jgi:hypothetical protein
MLKRLFLLLAGIWAMCCIAPEILSDHGNLTPKVLMIGLTPFVLIWLFCVALRFVVTGSFREQPRRPVVHRR